MYEVITFESEFKSNILEIEIEQKLGENYQFVPKEIQLIIHNISKLPKKIKGYSYNLNKNNNSLEIVVKLNEKTSKNIKIKF